MQGQLVEVVAVHNAGGAFAARKADGTVVAWGALAETKPLKWLMIFYRTYGTMVF